MHPALGLLAAYVTGSIPFAYIAGRLARGIDLREHGSGNLGATNVFRLLGWKVAVPVLLLDAAKGALPVLLLPRLVETTDPVVWAMAYGVAAIAGHVRSLFLLWRGGGKGVATAAGVFLALAPISLLLVTVLFAVVLWTSGYVSLGSLVSAAALPLAVLFERGAHSPIFWMSIPLALFVFWTHRANIGRLRRGEEHRFGKKKPAANAPGAGR
jgi:acyl phosphate:glycerol-3-phosphate acyltransferase